MVGRLSHCVLLSYRTPTDSVRGLLPPGLELRTHNGFAFWNIVVCRVERMCVANAQIVDEDVGRPPRHAGALVGQGVAGAHRDETLETPRAARHPPV